MYTRVKETYIC